jgi:hypothetical protein
MDYEPVAHRRRRSEVFRNIDDSLKVMGALSMKSLGLLFVLYAISYVLDVAFGFWKLLFGHAGVLVELLVFAAVAAALSYAERQDDEHLVPAMLRFYLSRPWTVLYSGAAPDGWPRHDYEWVFLTRGTSLPPSSAAQGAEP